MPHQAHVVHHIRGRMRVKLAHAQGDLQLLQSIQRSLSPLSGVEQVTINPITGSVLVEYDPGHHTDFHGHLIAQAAGTGLFVLEPPKLCEVDEIADKIEVEAEFLAAHSDTARAVVNFVKQLNEGVKKATDNTVDLKVLLPLTLAAYSFLKAGTELATPLWMTLGIFSFNSFVALHQPHQKVNVDEKRMIHGQPRKEQASSRRSRPPPAVSGKAGQRSRKGA
jgi:Heavy metal associated domain 2